MKSDQDPPCYRCHHNNTNRKGQEIVTFQNSFQDIKVWISFQKKIFNKLWTSKNCWKFQNFLKILQSENMLYFTISLTKALRLKVWVLPRNHKYLLKYSYIPFLWTGLIFTSWSFLTAVHDFYAKVSWNFAGLFGGQFPLIPSKIHVYLFLFKNHKCLLKEVFESNLLRWRV